MTFQIPVFDGLSSAHGAVAVAVVFPLAVVFIVGGIAGFIMGTRKRLALAVIGIAGLLSTLGYSLIGKLGLLTGALMPLMFIYGKS
jgi:hypothetical protein